MIYSIKHSTKGYFQAPDHWIVKHENAQHWATKFETAEAAKEVAGTLRSLGGKPLRLEIVVINAPKSEFGFESYRTVEIVEPQNQEA